MENRNILLIFVKELIKTNYIMSRFLEIEKAKELLKSHGYYVDILWCVEDVRGKFNCTDEQAQEVLDKALNNEATMEQIWFSINEFGNMFKLEEIIHTDNETDLFQLFSEDRSVVSEEMAKLIDEYGSMDFITYTDNSEFLVKAEKLGYTFDYGLSSEPFNLRKL